MPADKWILLFFFPSRNYGIMVTMFFAVSVINNYALNFNIAMPLHMIFRSVSVIDVLLLERDPVSYDVIRRFQPDIWSTVVFISRDLL